MAVSAERQLQRQVVDDSGLQDQDVVFVEFPVTDASGPGAPASTPPEDSGIDTDSQEGERACHLFS